jgi:hypothetical protein
MKGTRRWDKAFQGNSSRPLPPLIRPNAYDTKLRINQMTRTVYMGPVVPTQPVGQIAYDNANIIWEGGIPVQSVVASDDFSVDHTADPTWWADAGNFSHVANGQQDFSTSSGYAIFKKPAKAVEQSVIVKFSLLNEDPQSGVAGVMPALSVQDSWNDLFSLGMFWQQSAGPFWVQGQIASNTQQNLVSNVFHLNMGTDYWMRVGSRLAGPEISCEIFDHDPSQPGSEPLFAYIAPLLDVPKLAIPAYTGLHMIGVGVLLDEYRVEKLGDDPSSVVKGFDFKTVISHKYSGPTKWRDITIEWCVGADKISYTTYPVFI